MPEIVEDDVRAALRYRGDQLEALHQPELRSARPARIQSRWMAGLAAAACVLALVIGVGLVSGGFRRGGTASAPADIGAPGAPAYVGQQWRLTTILHSHSTTSIPAKLGVTVRFTPPAPKCPKPPPAGPQTCPGDIALYDGMSAGSGSYRATATGFVTSAIYRQAIGYAGHDPVQLASIDALGQINDSVDAVVDGRGRLVLTVTGYVMTFAKTGVVTEAPSPPAPAPTTGSAESQASTSPAYSPSR